MDWEVFWLEDMEPDEEAPRLLRNRAGGARGRTEQRPEPRQEWRQCRQHHHGHPGRSARRVSWAGRPAFEPHRCFPHPAAGFLLPPCVELWLDLSMRAQGERSENPLLEVLWAPSCGWTVSPSETFVFGWGGVVLILAKRLLRIGMG